MPNTPGPQYEFTVRGAPRAVLMGLRDLAVRAAGDASELRLDRRGEAPARVEVTPLRRAPIQGQGA